MNITNILLIISLYLQVRIIKILTTKKWEMYVVMDILNITIWLVYNVYMFQNITLCPTNVYNYYVSIKNK